MKINLHFFRNVFLIVSCFIISTVAIGQGIEQHTLPGVVRVKIDPSLVTSVNSVKTSLKNGVVTTGIQTFDNVNRAYSVVEMKRLIPYNAKYDERHRKHGLHLWYELKYTSNVSPMEAVATYSRLADVSIAEPIFEKQLIAGSVVSKALPTNVYGNAGTSSYNDTYLSDQWHYNNTGENTTDGIIGADINLYKAWEIETGKSNVVVSIVDGGFQTNHRDLVDNVWVNETELNGEEGVDDDGNGYVDDINGFNFVRNTGTIEQHYHGTHVAGTVAAVNNNGIGVAGVAGGSGNGDGVRIQSAQIFNDNSSTTNIAAAIIYGADNGAVISQNSWGFTQPGTYEQVVLDAIDYFIDEAGQYEGSPMKGGVVIFAAGNSAMDGAFYPGYYEPTIAISAIKPNNEIASYTNYGTWIDLASYGGDIGVAKNAAVLSTFPNHEYAYLDGTSMACPHVSGIAALVVSKHGGNDFTNENLKKHLLTATRDVDSFNPDYVGKLGLGILDAALALDTDEGIAPDPISDLTVIGLGQDFADIRWSVPSDHDDMQPVAFELYHHTEAITADNVIYADKEEIKNISAAATEINHSIKELDATTTYYFAIRSIDRWGNISELSNVENGTTNEGPDINTDVEELSMSADASVSTIANASFTILNEDEGVLEWEGMTRHTSHHISTRSNISYPQAKSGSAVNIQSHYTFDNPKPKNLPLETSANAITPMATYDEFYYGVGGNPIVIGETDTTYTNSSATRYYISQDEGFNLTKVQMFLQHRTLTGPMVMEIYVGEHIHKNNLVAVQEVDSYTSDYYWHNVYLEEDLYLETGTTFWIVFHVPSGNLFPLGMEREYMAEYSDNCYMSLDMGLTWMPLAEAIEDDRYAWTTAAVSENKHLGNYIKLTPSSGKVIGLENQSVDVEVDGTFLKNGSYNSNILIKSNDKDEKEYRIPLSFEITGHKAELIHDKVIDFGTVFYGRSKELVFNVENTGYGNFYRLSSASSDAQFEVLKDPYSISARSSGEFTVLYTPDGSGNDNSSLLLTDYYGNTHTINLFGVGVAPSEIEVGPLTQDIGTLSIGDNTSASINIANNGDYPLEFAIPAFADNIDIEGIGNVHKFGYTYESNYNGDVSATYYWNDISSDGEDISEFFMQPSNRYYEVDLGFEFPLYETKVSQLNITKAGILTLEQNSPFANCSPPSARSGCSPAGYISAVNKYFDLSKGGSIHYKRESGKFIIQYKDVVFKTAFSNDDVVSLQIILHYNGDVDFIYKDVANMSSYDRRNLQIGVGDEDYADPFLINGRYDYENRIENNIPNETIFRLKSPGQDLVKAVSVSNGLINPGESIDIELSINTEGLYESEMFQKLAIVSNDPFNSIESFEITANIIGGTPDVSLLNESVDFGSVYQGGIQKAIAAIKNDGTKAVEITSATLQNGNFTVDADLPYSLKSKSGYFIDLYINTEDKGVFNDVLTFETSEGISYEVSLVGEVTSAPGINVDTTPIVETLNAGEIVHKSIAVHNDGEVELDFLTNGSDWMYVNDITTSGNHAVKEFTYAASDSREEGGPVFKWDDIMVPGEGVNAHYWLNEDRFWYPIDLPFEFTFWGEATNKIWVSWEGVISTKEPSYSPEYIIPQPFPSDDNMNSLIAPLFTAHQESLFPDTEGYDEIGLFHKFYDDRIVVSWIDYVDMFFMGSKYSFQVILYKNGNIKFQYQAGRTSFLSNSVIGLENHDGTEAVQLSAYQGFAEDRLAVSLVPTTKTVVPVGESVALDLVLDADKLNKGVYNTNFIIESNAPQEEETMLPITLTVEGEPLLSAVDEINFGEVIAYKTEGTNGLELVQYSYDFTLENNGHDLLMINAIMLQDGSVAKALIKQVDPNWGWENWAEINMWNLPQLYPGDKAELRIQLAPEMLVADITDVLQIVSNLPTGDVLIPISASVNLPSVFEYPSDTLSFLAHTKDQTGSKTLTISNENGLSALNYDIAFNFRRAGADSETETASSSMLNSEAALPVLLKEQFGAGQSESVITPFASEFNNVLEYDTARTADNSVGYGEETALSAGITYTAPASGFNLTHVKTWYRYTPVLDSKIAVEIRAGGANVGDAQILTSQVFDINVDPADSVNIGEFFTLELDENQLFYPGEEFYIILTYDEGVPFPQGVNKSVEEAENRFFLKNEGAWYDLQKQNGFSTTGWSIKACEETAADIGWAKLDGEMTGEVAPGETLDLPINFFGNKAQEADNYGDLVITTNDPMNGVGVIPLYLRINQGPAYEVEGGLSQIVNENETLIINITGNDVEGDACTYALAEMYEFAEMTADGDNLTLTLTPGYEAAGIHTIAINGTDAYENVSTCALNIEVANVNRAPEVTTPIENTEIVLENGIAEINLSEHITDADMDNIVFEATGTDETVVDLFISDDRMMMDPLMPGTSTITVVATDIEGASVSHAFDLTVLHRTGLEELEGARISTYPNPVVDVLTIEWDYSVLSEVTFRLVNVAGDVVRVEENENAVGKHQMQVDDLAKGVYLLEMISEDEKIVKKIVIQN